MRRSIVAGAGSALPRRKVTNAELAATVDTSDEWIVERTGIRSRYIAGEGETTGSLATEAARRALASAGIEAASVKTVPNQGDGWLEPGLCGTCIGYCRSRARSL